MHGQDRPTPKARFAYVGGEESDFAALAEAFSVSGYALVRLDEAYGADLSLIDLRGKNVSVKKAQSITALLRRKSPESSILIVVDPYLNDTARMALRRHGEVVCIGAKPDALIAKCRHLLRLRNVAEEAGERLKTLATLNRLSEFPPIAAPPLGLRVLIAGEAGPAALTAINALRPESEQCMCVFSAGQAMRAIETSRFDCAIFLPSRESDPLMSLAKALRRHPKHNALPVIYPLLDVDYAEDFVPRGASDFILMRHIASDLLPKCQTAARRARLLKTMRRFLNACTGQSIRDESSGAFTSLFLSEHGARICGRADQSGRPLALIAIKINASALDNNESPFSRSAQHQATKIINRVTRAEDTTARIAPDSFLVLAPATTEHDARQTALRIRGVMENTAFKGERDKLHYGVKVDIAAVARPAGHCIEECVALALKGLQEAQSIKPLSQQLTQ
ncbi:diguanylate cyclase [Hyphococcus flavus]|uniref:Diguanylate cyclase n=1 Tax=Hyphococcus flavus TaxID=1866326 RepID=A0AAE9ZE78_9PROT|nr:diguanylate cyclase [Hyphococcus flavus]WDI31083.1 diguanylate cyclase [Hyphococcus flavus]